MKVVKSLLYMMTLLLTSTAVLSCSMEMPDGIFMESDAGLKTNSVMINGIVADEDMNPLEGISIHFTEYIIDNEEESLYNSTVTQTDDKGYYVIYMYGSPSPMHCHVKAEDSTGKYTTQETDIYITWDGPSYDKDTKLFVVNDHNFIMHK